MYYTYILQSEQDGSLYIGQTNNMEDRLIRHNSGRNKYTKSKRPWKIIYTKSFETRSEAMLLEKYLKSLKNKDYILQWVSK